MIKKILLLGFILFSSKVMALENISKWNIEQPYNNIISNDIKEEFEYDIRDNKIYGITAIYTIPDNYSNQEIIITSSLFDELSKSSAYMPGDGITVNLKVINNSKYDYNYVDNSFVLSTEDLENYKNSLSPIDNTKAFNGKVIYYEVGPMRTANKAIQDLYQVKSTSKVTKEMLQDELIDIKLKEIKDENNNQLYPEGIKQLNKYYLDYYNKKLNTNYQSLEEFDYNTISNGIFGGNNKDVKETNIEIAELGYNYWYNVLYSWNFYDQEYSEDTSDNYSFGYHMRNKDIGNKYFKDTFNVNSNSEKILENSKINLNFYLITNAFMNYNFSGYLEFRLDRKIDEVEEIISQPSQEENDDITNVEETISTIDNNFNKIESNTIKPPKTGIEKRNGFVSIIGIVSFSLLLIKKILN